MSAIWGMISKKECVSEHNIFEMQQAMQGFKIDRVQSVSTNNIYFACGLQYFTQEAELEVLPLHDKEKGIVFTADCVLNNRDEIIRLLEDKYPVEELRSSGDGKLALCMFMTYGEAFVEQLRGSFSFAVYEEASEKLLLYADHFARRYLTYYADDERVLFSTVYQPILSVLNEKQRELNRRWIATAYSDCTADTIKLRGETVYKNIYHVEPGNYVCIYLKKNKVEKHCYWNPLRETKRLSLPSDEEYKQLFLSTFRKATAGLLRTSGEVGILLSGGLDSSSVAAFAATGLDGEGKQLYGYTAVPGEDYLVKNTRISIEDEREYVYAQEKMYSNIIPKFISAKDTNCFSRLEEHAMLYFEPVKPIINIVYHRAMLEQAEMDGCRLMFSGQNGNATISYGGILTFVYQKICSMGLKQALLGVRDFCNRHRVSKKHFAKVFCKAAWEEKIKRFHVGDDCFLSDCDLKAYSVERIERRIQKNRGTGYMDSVRQRKGFGFMPEVYQHMGFFDTYDSLRHGILQVDPTLTKEVVELCLSMPIDCFVKAGKERRAIRDYMRGYVPDMILDNYAGRGVQAADYAFRVNRDWAVIKEDVYRLLTNPKLSDYLDQNKVNQLIREVGENEGNFDKSLVAKCAVISSLSAFLNVQ